VTTSEVDVLVTERENDVIYQCHGTNEVLGQTVVDTITLKVMCKMQRLLCTLLSHNSRTNSKGRQSIVGKSCILGEFR